MRGGEWERGVREGVEGYRRGGKSGCPLHGFFSLSIFTLGVERNRRFTFTRLDPAAAGILEKSSSGRVRQRSYDSFGKKPTFSATSVSQMRRL